MKRWQKVVGFAGCAASLLVAGWIGYQLYDFFGPAVSLRKLARLNSGMDTNGVAKLLGAPAVSNLFTNDDGRVNTIWTYTRDGRWKFVTLNFGPDGKFSRYYED